MDSPLPLKFCSQKNVSWIKSKPKALCPGSEFKQAGIFAQPRPRLRKALASWQSLFSKVARSTNVCPRHTSNDFNTGETNPVQIISNIDLVRPSFPVNIYFLLAATMQEILSGLALSPFLSLLRTKSWFYVHRGFFPRATLTSLEDRCDLFKQQGCTWLFIHRTRLLRDRRAGLRSPLLLMLRD